MLRVACPNCRQRLKVSERAQGKSTTCPKCKKRFRVADEKRTNQPELVTKQQANHKQSRSIQAQTTAPQINSVRHSSADKSSQLVLVLVCLFVGNVMLFLGSALATSLGFATFLLIVAVFIEIVAWQRKHVFKIVGQAWNTWHHNRAELAGKQAAAGNDNIVEDVEVVQPKSNDDRRPHATPARHKSQRSRKSEMTGRKRATNSDELETIQRGANSSHRSEPVPSPPRTKPKRWQKKMRNYGPLPPVAKFFQAHERLDLGFGEVVAPLVYATSKAHHGRFDASLIDSSLPISRSGGYVQPLPYWPNFYDSSASQRGVYLDWLVGGRCDPNVELGYVFIYFYGLERRVIVDRDDYVVIANELMRLLPIYGSSNSFRNYTTRLMWLAMFLHSREGNIGNQLLERAISATTRWTDDLLEYLLAILHHSDNVIPSQIAIVIAQNDHRSTNSVIVRRHEQQFNQLFLAKYKACFPDGFLLEKSKRPKRVPYHPASATLMRDNRWQNQLPQLPDVLKITSQFKPLVEIWESCIHELKDFNRLHRKADGKMTSEVYEALPPELREDDHPEYDSWIQLWERNANGEGWPIVPISELAKLKEIEPRKRLTKTQSRAITQTAQAIGIGFVPDFEVTNRNYAWDETVCLFFEQADVRRNKTAYKAAAILLRLGMNIAAADGSIDKVEMDHIDNHLEESFDLSDADSKRLECLTYLLSKCPDADNSITKSLCNNLTKSNRKLVGEFLVGIAAADQVLDSGEICALKKAYRALELEAKDLDDLLSRFTTETRATGNPLDEVSDKPLHLDMGAIAQIVIETREVSKLLQDAMGESEFDDKEVQLQPDSVKSNSNENPMSVRIDDNHQLANDCFADLPQRYHAFLEKAVTQTTWDADQLESLARENGQMLGGAVDAINEWSYEKFEDWLIEEGSEYQIHAEILEQQ